MRTALTCLLVAAGLFLTGGCTLLPSQDAPEQTRYSLQLGEAPDGATRKHSRSVLVPLPDVRGELATDGMAYRTAEHEFGYFVRSRWADNPRDMLHSLLIESLARRGPFDRVVQPGTPINPDYRLNLEVHDFAQDFRSQPSRYRVKARVQLIDLGQRRIVAEQLLSLSEPSPREDARGGAMAANQVVNRLLDELHVVLSDALPHAAQPDAN